MLKVALTGGAATGKSYVLDQFRRHGIPCLVADDLAHGVTAAGTEATSAIAARFGADVIAQDGSVNRDALGAIVFADDAARRELEAIVHPGVYRAIEAGLRAFAKLGDSTLAVVEIPLLYETGHTLGDFDRVIVTACSRRDSAAAADRAAGLERGTRSPNRGGPEADRGKGRPGRLRHPDRRREVRDRRAGAADPSGPALTSPPRASFLQTAMPPGVLRTRPRPRLPGLCGTPSAATATLSPAVSAVRAHGARDRPGEDSTALTWTTWCRTCS